MYRPHTSATQNGLQKVQEQPSTRDSMMQAADGRRHSGSNSNSVHSHAADEFVDVENDLRRASRGSSMDATDEPESTSTTSSYSGEWNRLFTKENYKTHLKAYCMSGKLRSSRFRSVCWKIYLEVLPEDRNQWLVKTRHWREHYKHLKNTLVVNPRREMDTASDLALNNPLSQEVESPWNQFFLDNELRLTIKQDVIRTFPEIEFFQAPDLHEKMVDVLFCYVKHKQLQYKQGMHELLAPLIFVLHCDHQAYLHASEVEHLEKYVQEILDPDFIEHDAYAMFCQILETVEPWYMCRENTPPQTQENVPAQPFARPSDFAPTNAILTKLTRVHDYLLKKFDPDLHAILEQMEIAPQIYGIRWVRLLFGREFPMQDLLVLWDAIFSDGISFDLVDYIFVAMLLYLKDYMMTSDYASCLKCLMRYPPVGDVHYMVQKALYLREPSQYIRPPDYTYTVQGLALTNGAGQKYIRAHTKYHEKPRTLMSGLSSLTRRFNTGRPGSLGLLGGKMRQSSSEPMKLQTEQSPAAEVVYVYDAATRRKRGSASSLPALGETERSGMRPTISSQSLAQLETGGREIGSDLSPEPMSSPGQKYATLPSRSRKSSTSRKQSKLVSVVEDLLHDIADPYSRQEAALEHQISYLQGKMNEMESMCQYCAAKMDGHIGKLQSEMLRQEVENEDEILLTLAGLKQVRDVLKGTLKFSVNMMDNEEVSIKDNYYREDASSQASSAASSAHSSPAKVRSLEFGAAKKRGAYQMDSGETSSDLESPDVGDPLVHSLRLKDSRKEIELSTLEGKKSRSNSRNGNMSVGH